MKEYKLKGKDALDLEGRSIVARWVLFLKSEQEYEWPSASFKQAFIKTITLGAFGQSTLDKWNEYGDISNWPFKNKDQFYKAKLGNGYLGVKNT